MKKLVKTTAFLLGATAAGLLVWRKIEADRLENDLWSEAEAISAQQDAQSASQK
ncbi:DLW-39 family protein [Brachybacterium hainanense]|uniref:DLW-39 family protein n=1 Tax=Brachybacterium hainanense TaxID=1541174 RepID=A0ABV6RDB8_9MICO